MAPKTLRNKINSKVLTFGSWVNLGHPAIAEIMAKARFDWLVVGLEHSVIGIDIAGELIRLMCRERMQIESIEQVFG